LKDFDSIYNKNKEIEGVESSKYKYGAYNWSIQAYVKKYKNKVNGKLWFLISLNCESDEQINFPLFANIKYSILNNCKNTRKDFSRSNFYCKI
jgi:hypothetical protein